MATTKVTVFHDSRKRQPWVVRWFGEYDPATDRQRRYSKSFRLKRDAERFQAEKQAEFDKGAQRDRPECIALGEFTSMYLKRRRREWRDTTYQNQEDLANRLVKFFGSGRRLDLIRPKDAHQFWMESGPVRSDLEDISKETRNRLLREAKTLFEHAVKWEYLRANPFADLKQQKVRKKDRKDWRYITPEEYLALLEASPSPEWRGFYAVAYTGGLRFGECVNLTAANLDSKNGLVLVRNRAAEKCLPPFDVKDHEDREVPIPKSTVELLVELVKDASDESPFLTLSRDRNQAVREKWQAYRRSRKPWSNRCMLNNSLREFRRHARWAGISDADQLTIHTLRKSAGVNWANVLPIHVTQAYMGHSDIKTTQQYYLTVGEEHAQQASSAIEYLITTANATDARVTPGPVFGNVREVG